MIGDLVVALVLGGAVIVLARRMTGVEDNASWWQRLILVLLCLALILVGFVAVVQVRCALGWNENECPAWGDQGSSN